MKTVLFSIVLLSAMSIAGCDDGTPEKPEQTAASKAKDDAGGLRRITWLESTDKVKPELWLAALQMGSDEPSGSQIAIFRKLLVLGSTEYLESPRMVANRTAQLVTMLRENGQTENHEQVLKDLLSLPKSGTTGNARTMSTVAAQYVNLRRGGMNRLQALETLRDGRPAASLERFEEKLPSSPDDAERPALPPSKPDDIQSAGVDLSSINIASVMTPDEVSQFVYAAANVSQYAVPTDLPRIARISEDDISRVLCGGKRCSAVAFFDDRSQTVFVDQRLDLEKNLIARSFVVHEVVHFFHLLDGKLAPGMGCRARIVLEQEAYRAQNEYLAQEGSQHRVSTRLLRSLCRGG